VRDAYGHLKVIGATAAARPLLVKAAAAPDAGIVALDGADSLASFISAAAKGRVWDRDEKVRPPV
jgi:catalase